MNKFLTAIGFRSFSGRRELDQLIKNSAQLANSKENFQIDNNQSIRLSKRYFGDKFGIAVVECIDKDEYKSIDHYFPFVDGVNFYFHDNMEFEHFSDREGFSCLCDENNMGIPLIFHVNNPVEYLLYKDSRYGGDINSVSLSGLATEGTVILPMNRNLRHEEEERKDLEKRNQMIDAAKTGDVDAMEQLAMDDMDTYNTVKGRSKKEDIFTIVTSYFMPYSLECDKYSILGKIRDVKEVCNIITMEKLYYISVECNSIDIDVLISRKDLLGEPEVGRRLKATVWLQGNVDCI